MRTSHIFLLFVLIASGASRVQAQCSPTYVGSTWEWSVDAGGFVSTSPTGPHITWQWNAAHTKKDYTIEWTDPGTYSVGVRAEPESPLVETGTFCVYYSVPDPIFTPYGIVCASKISTDYHVTSSNDTRVHDYSWIISPSTAYTNLSYSGNPPQQDLHVAWNVNYIGYVTITARAHGYGDDHKDKTVTIERKVIEPSYSISTGTLNSSGTISGCEGNISSLSVTGATNTKWYTYNKWCDNLNLNTIPPNDRFAYCHKEIIQDNGTSSNGLTTIPIYMVDVQIVLKGTASTCNASFTKTFDIVPQIRTHYIGIDSLFTARLQGPDTSRFDIVYSGFMNNYEWAFNPPEAGTISTTGKVIWNPSFNSYNTSGQVSNLVSLSVKTQDCAGWTDHPIHKIRVVPLLDFEENHVRVTTPQKKIQSIDSVVTTMQNPLITRVADSFFDGLGRNVQNIQYFGSTIGKDIIELKRYDEFGREAIKNLPFVEAHDLDYHNDAIETQAGYYQTPGDVIPDDDKPFAKTIFEKSPLNRVIEQGAVGTDWQPGTNHTFKVQYLTNAANEILMLHYDTSSGLSADVEYYDENELMCTKTIDEHQNDVLEYVDKEGKTVCKKVKAATGVHASTYYVYDDIGNLVVVLSPEAVQRFLTSNGN